MIERASTNYEMAVRDFHRARKSAVLRQILARLKGQSNDLLNYELICEQLQATDSPVMRGVEEIRLDKIVGSVGRHQDFTREFLPKQGSDESRWAKVKAAFMDMSGLPPIQVYQIGDGYFVLDGNHRVSVARKSGMETIPAYVTVVQTRVPLSVNDDADELICKARYADFLQRTNLDLVHPEIDLSMTICGHYQTLIKQIDIQYRLLTEAAASNACKTVGRDISWEKAALQWYEAVYLPVIKIMRELGVMRRFPERTEADIYVLLSERREELERTLSWHLDLEETIPTLVEEQARPARNISTRTISKVMDPLRTDILEGALVGTWRSQQLAMHREKRLFADMLVLFEGIDEDWDLLEAALRLAADDHDRVLGLHVVATPDQLDRTYIREMKARFLRRCEAAGLTGEFAVEAGNDIPTILKRVAWSDLLLINLTHPPESNLLARLRSFWGPMIMRCPRPLLIVPHAKYEAMSPLLLAYDGSPKSNEALFVATYHASRWKGELTVLTVQSTTTGAHTLARAKAYLEEHGVFNASYILSEGHVGKAIIETANARHCNLIVAGGIGASPMVHLLRGSSIEYVLQHTTQSVMICQ